MLRRLICLLGRHHRLGRAVEWDGMNFRSICRHCGTTLYKHGNVRWRPVRRQKDVLLLTYQAHDVAAWPEDWQG